MCPRMRQGELRVVADLVAADDEVHVEGARSPGHLADTLERLLDTVRALEDRPPGQRGIHRDHGVEVAGLLGAADGHRLVDGRGSAESEAGRVEQGVDRALQVLQPVSQVTAERQHDSARVRRLGRCGHARLRWMVTDTSSNAWGSGACGL